MRDVIGRRVRIPLWLLIAFGTLLLLVISAAWLVELEDPRLVGVVAGLVSGLAVYLITFSTQVFIWKRVVELEAMGIKGVLKNRFERDYYAPIVGSARNEVLVLGSSASRFIADFLDPDTDEKVLFNALQRHGSLTVRILIPKSQFMSPSSLARWEAEKPKLRKIHSMFDDRIQVRRYEGLPSHSLVRADNDLVVGPIFPEVESRNAPAVHLATSTAYADKYVQHFWAIWKKSEPEIL